MQEIDLRLRLHCAMNYTQLGFGTAFEQMALGVPGVCFVCFGISVLWCSRHDIGLLKNPGGLASRNLDRAEECTLGMFFCALQRIHSIQSEVIA